jgi:hypothetical protein
MGIFPILRCFRSSYDLNQFASRHQSDLALKSQRKTLRVLAKDKIPMQESQRPIDIRVTQSLQRVGYKGIQVEDLGDGHVKLTGITASPNDRAIMISAARAVVGVRHVATELTFDSNSAGTDSSSNTS